MENFIFCAACILVDMRLRYIIFIRLDKVSLCEMCPSTEFFLVCIFPHSDCIRKDTKYLSVFSPNEGKYGPEKTLCLGTFHAVCITQ